nr:uncharacterized protein LOC123745932 [Procambarus clarkii]
MRESGTTITGGARRRICIGCLGLLDSFLSIFVFAPLVVGYWRGCWQLMDEFLLPGHKQLSVATSFAMGVFSGMLFCLLQRPLNTFCNHSRRPSLHLLVSRLYTSVYCVCCVNHWRGVWAAWDLYTGISWQSGATSMGIGLLTLAITRGLKNILAPPFIVVTDHPTGYFNVPTLFRAEILLRFALRMTTLRAKTFCSDPPSKDILHRPSEQRPSAQTIRAKTFCSDPPSKDMLHRPSEQRPSAQTIRAKTFCSDPPSKDISLS